jgi:Xaa-Pro aminopeptidase
MAQLDHRDGIDLGALRRKRRAKACAAMTDAGVDALVLTKVVNVEYATGIAARRGDASLDGGETVAAVLRADGRVCAFTRGADDLPPAAGIVSAGWAVSFDVRGSVEGFARACGECVGGGVRVGVDRLSASQAHS